MPRFDRYLLQQLLVVWGFFSLVLILIYWINRAVILFDRIISDGQGFTVFLELTALALPGLMKLVLPLSAFFAALYVTNKLTAESEMVVVQATGYSAFRLARPYLIFGLIVAGAQLVLMHVLEPAAARQTSEREAEIAQNVTARFLTEGQFLNPADGVTFYIRDITPEGELLDVFLSDTRSGTEQTIYSANRAFIVRTDAGPQLVMIDGLAQTLRLETQSLFTTRFDDFAYNIGSLIDPAATRAPRPRELDTLTLLNPTEEALTLTERPLGDLITEGHERFAQPLLGIVGALLGFSALMLGGFSRFGVWRQVCWAIFLVMIVKAIESAVLSIAFQTPGLWPLMYLPAIFGIGISVLMLWISQRPYLFKRRPQEVT